ncbi:hypothetical protein IFR05_002637 [Cadophora sp. M221]|nr:hypothetical protein IFR05_002637 [Cadophora sp. M221]
MKSMRMRMRQKIPLETMMEAVHLILVREILIRDLEDRPNHQEVPQVHQVNEQRLQSARLLAPPQPARRHQVPQIISSSFVAPPVSFSLVSTTAISTTLVASSIPFSTLSPQQTSVAPTITPIISPPPPGSTISQTLAQDPSLSSAQSNGNGFVPSVPSTSVSTSSSTSSTSKSPTAMSAAYGISSGKSAPTGTLIGIVVTILISGLLLFFLRRRKQQKSYLSGNRSTGASQSFWDRVSGLPPDLGGGAGRGSEPLVKTSPYAQDFNSFTPFSPPPVNRQFDTSSSDDNIDMPPPALFIPATMTNGAPAPPPIFTTQRQRPQTPLRLVPNSQPYGTTTTIRTGPLSLSWFLGKPSKIPKPTPQNANFLEPTGYGSNEKVDMGSRITQMEADMREQEQRWEDSRREMANRSSGWTDGQTENRKTVRSEGWESGIGDARSARFLSGIGSDTTGRGSFAIQNARMEYLQPVTSQEMVIEQEKRTIENARRAKWESSPDSLNELPRWRDPVLSIFEEVRDKTGGPVSPHRVI